MPSTETATKESTKGIESNLGSTPNIFDQSSTMPIEGGEPGGTLEPIEEKSSGERVDTRNSTIHSNDQGSFESETGEEKSEEKSEEKTEMVTPKATKVTVSSQCIGV